MQDKWRNTDLNVSLYWPEFLALPPYNGLRGPCLAIQLPPETTNTSSQTSREEMEDKFTDSTGNKAATPTSKCNQWSEDDLATKVCSEALIIITGVSRYIQVPY